MKTKIRSLLTIFAAFTCCELATAQTATVDLSTEYQTIRGFGGMNHPSWGVDLTEAQCSTAFGNGDNQLGFSILRIYVHEDKNYWSRELTTTKRAINLGATVFATPWNPPSDMVESVSRNNRTEQILKKDSYDAYAQHLVDYNNYMKNNGIQLYAMSFANEPDYGHTWTWYSEDEVYNFTKNQAAKLRVNGTKVITAESFSYQKKFYDKILDDATALANIDIIGTHFYASDANTNDSFFQYEKADQKASDKERWMTEHYTTSTESEGGVERANVWPEALDVSYEIHRAMAEGNFSAYVWWYIRRFYGPILDDGSISKRGYCMAQYSKFVRPGYVRVKIDKNPTYNVYTTAYKNGDDVVIVAVNRSTVTKTLTFSIPNTKVKTWSQYVTSGTKSLAKGSDISAENGSFQITLDAQSTTTFVGKASTSTDNKETEIEEETPATESTVIDGSKAFENISLTKSYKSTTDHNPLMTQRFGADPYAMVYNGEVFIYMTNDVYQYDSDGNLTTNSYGQINTINCISSKDLVNWTDHGAMKIAGSNGAAKWANCSWAPTAMHATVDGKEKFFLYFANNGSGIGVVTSDTPYGPWTDPIGKELISRNTPTCSSVTWLFDPAVLLDDDGTAYLYFGGGVPTGQSADPGTARVVKLGKDYISLDGSPKQLNPPYLFEDAGANKIGGKYLYSYCSNWNCTGDPMGSAQICYMTSTKPMEGFNYTNMVFKNPGVYFSDSYGNNHHAIFKFLDQYYITYHALVLQNNMGITGGYRSTHIDKIPVDTINGTIGEAKGTLTGVDQVASFNPYLKVEGETMAWMGGIDTKEGGSNMLLSSIDKGDWIGLSKVNFSKGIQKIMVSASATSSCMIKICVDKADGEVVGYIEIPNTNGKLQEITSELNTEITGEHNLFFVFSGSCELDYWRIYGKEVPQAPYENITQTIPGTIEAERYDVGGESYAYHDDDDENEGNVFRNDGVDIDGNETNGYVVGWTKAGEWLEYTIDVKNEGTYNWSAIVASGVDNSGFTLYLDDEAITDPIVVPNTDGWGWSAQTTVQGTTKSLSAGTHVLKIAIDGSYCNIDKLIFTSSESSLSNSIASGNNIGYYQVYTVLGVYVGTMESTEDQFELNIKSMTNKKGVFLLKNDNGFSRLIIVK